MKEEKKRKRNRVELLFYVCNDVIFPPLSRCKTSMNSRFDDISMKERKDERKEKFLYAAARLNPRNDGSRITYVRSYKCDRYASPSRSMEHAY